MAWGNFKELREKLVFRDVLEFYGVKINAKNHVQHHGKCPLPTHDAVNRTSSFSAQLDKGIWRCFGCSAKGNILDFATRMEKFDPAPLVIPVLIPFPARMRCEKRSNFVQYTPFDRSARLQPGARLHAPCIHDRRRYHHAGHRAIASYHGQAHYDALPNYCKQCEVRQRCNGECPKHRFILARRGAGAQLSLRGLQAVVRAHEAVFENHG